MILLNGVQLGQCAGTDPLILIAGPTQRERRSVSRRRTEPTWKGQGQVKVLVTGGAGFIGSHTVDLLLARGYEVRVLDSLQPRVHPRGLPSYFPSGAEFMQGDVADRSTLASALRDVDAVVHLAAYQDYLPDFHSFIHVNAESTALLFELIVQQRLPVRKMVLASSQSVAGEGRYECADDGVVFPGPRPQEQLQRGEWEVVCPKCKGHVRPLLIDEATANPHTSYGISKYALELLALGLGRRYGIPTACMRYSYVQGPRNSLYNAYSGVLRRFALQIMYEIAPTIYEDGQQLRDYVNVSDVARANVLVLERDEANFGVFNVGPGRGITVLEFVKIVLAEFKSNLEPKITGAFRLGDTRHTVSDINRIRALGWSPTTPVTESVAQYRKWLVEQEHTKDFLTEADRVMREAGVVQFAAMAGRG